MQLSKLTVMHQSLHSPSLSQGGSSSLKYSVAACKQATLQTQGQYFLLMKPNLSSAAAW